MKKAKDKFLTVLDLGDKKISVRASVHSLKRMKERRIEEFIILENILALENLKLKELQEAQGKIIIINEEKRTSVLIGFKKNTLNIITVIKNKYIFNSRKTEEIRI